MDSVIRKIFESISSGNIDKKTGLEILNAFKQQKTNDNNDIVIIGISIKLPQANNLEEFYRNIHNGKNSIREFPKARKNECKNFITNFTTIKENDIKYSKGGYLDDINEFDYDFFNISPKEASLMDPNQRLFLENSWKAIEDAGYGGNKICGTRTGVYLGFADWPVYGQYISKRQPSMVTIASAGNTPSLIASRISYLLDLKGPAFLVDTACSSSLVAVHLACKAIQNKECDMALAGGVKVCLMPVDGVFEMGIESSTGKICTFDDSADGTVWGEGVVSLLLKPLSRAIKDCDNIYAIIKGSSINQDGASVGITAPNASAQEDVIVRAWEDAGIDPETITYIEAHGTGTKLGDPIEIDGIQRAFRKYTQKKQFCSIASVKTNIGHLDSASGITALIKAIVSLKYKELLPTLNFTLPNSKIAFENSPVYINDKLNKWVSDSRPRRCGVSSFGFSGTNCHVVLEETSGCLEEASTVDDKYKILTLSAKNKTVLKQLVKNYISFMQSSTSSISNICYTASTGRGHYSNRLAILCLNKEELLHKLKELAKNDLNFNENNEIFIGEHKKVTIDRIKAQQGQLTTDDLRRLNERSVKLINEILEEYSKEKQCELLDIYVKGAHIDWELLHSKSDRRKVRIPTYPFQTNKCWIDMPTQSIYEDNIIEGLKNEKSINDENDNNFEVVLSGRNDNKYTDNEKKIANVWGQLLGHKKIDIDDDFFEIGGNSISAIRMEVELEKCGIVLSSEQLYVNPSIKELSVLLSGESSINISNKKNKKALNKQIEDLNELSSIKKNGEDKIIISNIEPFNEIFFKNCFYNSLFPIVHHFGQNINPFLINDLVLFEQNDKCNDVGYSMAYFPIKSTDDILKDMGLNFEKKYQSEDIISEIIENISNQKLIILWVDSFYESIRNDVYLKEHINHTLLIYGFDKKEKLFHIIEHDRQENLSYKKCVIPFADVENAFNGYIQNFGEYVEEGTFYIINHYNKMEVYEITKQNTHELYQIVFAENILRNTERIEKSILVLNKFIHSFNSLVDSKENLKKNNEYLVSFCNDVINAKKIEKYRLSKLCFTDNQGFVLLCDVINKWEIIRKRLVRSMYQPIYKPQVLQLCHKKLIEIEEDEKAFNKILCSELKDYINYSKTES